MAYQLPWERANIKAVIDAFKCKVMGVHTVAPQEVKKLVVWRDWGSGETHVESMTYHSYGELYEQLERHDMGVIVGSEWDSESK